MGTVILKYILFVMVYTGFGGLEEFVAIGDCLATFEPHDGYNFPIIVPRESISFEFGGGEGDPKQRFKVSLK